MQLALDEEILARDLLREALLVDDCDSSNALLALMCAHTSYADLAMEQRQNVFDILPIIDNLTVIQRQKAAICFLQASLFEESFDGLVTKGKNLVKSASLTPA